MDRADELYAASQRGTRQGGQRGRRGRTRGALQGRRRSQSSADLARMVAEAEQSDGDESEEVEMDSTDTSRGRTNQQGGQRGTQRARSTISRSVSSMALAQMVEDARMDGEEDSVHDDDNDAVMDTLESSDDGQSLERRGRGERGE